MSLNFQPRRATKQNARLRMALIGPAGSGKTFSALNIASHLAPSGRVLVIDTERGSASKYASDFNFDVFDLDEFSPTNYCQCIEGANGLGYDVVIIDSLSHAWNGRGGALEMVDDAAKRERGNSFGAWRNVTPLHNQMVDAILGCRSHVIVTMRAKTEYVQEKDPKSGRTVVRKVGLAPVQRDGMEYEFDVVADMDAENNFIVTKSRCSALTGAVMFQPGAGVAEILNVWLTDGEPEALAPPAPPKDAVAQIQRVENIPELSNQELRNWMLWVKDNCPNHPQKTELKSEFEKRKAAKQAAQTQSLEAEVADENDTTPIINRWQEINLKNEGGEGYAAFLKAVADAGCPWASEADVEAFEAALSAKLEVKMSCFNAPDAEWPEWANLVALGDVRWGA